MRNKLIYAVVVVFAVLAVGLTGFYSGFQQGISKAEAEFYRGGYAICLWFAYNIFWMPPSYATPACQHLIEGAIGSDAYGQDYPGW